jgi:hypothetical protein
MRKPLIMLLEPLSNKGGLTMKEIEEGVIRADGKYQAWGLTAEMASWSFALPAPDCLYDLFFSKDPIEWNRGWSLRLDHCASAATAIGLPARSKCTGPLTKSRRFDTRLQSGRSKTLRFD